MKLGPVARRDRVDAVAKCVEELGSRLEPRDSAILQQS